MIISILQEEQLQLGEREKLSKNRELTEAQQQLRQKVDVLVFDDVTAHHISFILQEEQLQSSEREKQTVQQQLTSKVNSEPLLGCIYSCFLPS